MRIVVIGLSITSSWGNGHATTYRSLLRELAALGHDILFLEHDVPYYATHRDMPEPSFCKTKLYASVEELKKIYETEIKDADVVIVGSYVKNGVEVGDWVTKVATGITAFYDIDTPVTLAKLARNDFEYLHPDLIPRYQIYFSFSGGPTLQLLENKYGSPSAKDLYCSVDPDLYYPEKTNTTWDLGYLGTYSPDRQPILENLMVEAARINPTGLFVVAGPQYPDHIKWPKNVQRIQHLPPADHRKFYNSQRFTLNVTREDMVKAGYSPSVRLFEAAACGVPVISDYWEGIATIFEPGKEILISTSAEETLHYLYELSEEERMEIGKNARLKTLKYHTASSRAKQLEQYLIQVSSLIAK